ncbi:hypothetical protein UKMH10_5488 [Burkholderia pseudomallei]|nr:hypothetical protein UKMH10_5488 [Burkholderia pseudomallei]
MLYVAVIVSEVTTDGAYAHHTSTSVTFDTTDRRLCHVNPLVDDTDDTEGGADAGFSATKTATMTSFVLVVDRTTLHVAVPDTLPDV